MKVYNLDGQLNRLNEQLNNSNISDASDTLRFSLEKVFNKKYDKIIRENIIDGCKLRKLNKYISLRCKHIPLDNIIGYKDFLGVRIRIDRNTLSPRFETEFLVDIFLKDMKSKKGIRVLDLCTGSGCIGLSVAKNTDFDVSMSDISKSALCSAKFNAKSNSIIDRVNIIHSDMFSKISGKYDVIISNPPYIRTNDLKSLDIEVRDFDPFIALDGGDDGLEFYEIIADESYKYLEDNGRLYLEIGYDQGEEVSKLLEKNFKDIKVVKDISGMDRYIIAKRR